MKQQVINGSPQEASTGVRDRTSTNEVDAADFETFNGYIGKVLVGIGRWRRDGGKGEGTAER